MRFHRLTLLASVFLTVAMSLVALGFDYTNDAVFHSKSNFYLTLFVCVVLIFALNYVILDYLFNFYGKKQIRKFSTILPEDISPDDDNEMDFCIDMATKLGFRKAIVGVLVRKISMGVKDGHSREHIKKEAQAFLEY